MSVSASQIRIWLCQKNNNNKIKMSYSFHNIITKYLLMGQLVHGCLKTIVIMFLLRHPFFWLFFLYGNFWWCNSLLMPHLLLAILFKSLVTYKFILVNWQTRCLSCCYVPLVRMDSHATAEKTGIYQWLYNYYRSLQVHFLK